ncbi:MAG: GNAT family N-acetyltransferase [Chloroflexota bacterium]|nr:MAG: GNAT family N-acetyltransferase [Chloroflexota bacterium]
MILIRNFCFPEDYSEVHRLWSQAGPGIHVRRSDNPEEIAKKLERDPDLFLLAVSEGKIVGSVIGGFDGRRGMVYHLAVQQEYRNQGIGAALMDELEARLREKGCIRYYLLVTADNEGAIRFYENRGMERMDLYSYGKDLD